MKKILFIIFLMILLIIPLFLFNDKKTNNIKKKSIKLKKEEPVELFKYITTNYDNINEYIKVEEKEVEEIKYVCIDEE